MTPPPVPDQIRSNIINLMVQTSRYEAGRVANIDQMIRQLGADLIKQLLGAGLDTPRTDWQRSRLEALLKEATATINGAYGDMSSTMEDDLRGLIKVTGKGVVSAVNSALGADIMIPPKWTPELLSSLVDGTLINGAPSADWWSRQGQDLAQAFADQMRQGMLRGETITQLRDRIMGQNLPGVGAVGKVDLRTIQPNLRPPIWTARRNAEALVRTSTITVNSAAHEAAYAANADIMDGVAWAATLDARTCPRCGGLDGMVWKWGEDHPTPSLHWGCRCMLLPKTKSFEQLAREAHGNSTLAKELDSMDESTRASMGGQVSGNLTYPEWFDAQSEARQLDILGPKKLALYQKGGLDFVQMLDQRGNVLTLKQLEEIVG